MSVWVIMLIGLLMAVGLFGCYWVLQWRIGDSGVVDVFWGASVAIVGVFFCSVTPGNLTRRWIGAVLIVFWAARLSFYLYGRWKSHPEDARYTALKQKWGDAAQIRMFRFYQMQALGCYLFALPLMVAGYAPEPVGGFEVLAIVIWLVAIIGESVADRQLEIFRQNPENRGEVCQVGLWRYSRHPNYFFEWLHWWTYVVLAIGSPFGWTTILAPISMWFFLNRVTGIPTTEAQAIISRGEKYRRYQQTTNAFFPWFPKSNSVGGKHG